MGVGDRIELRLDGVDHPPLAMHEAVDRGSARRVEIAPAGGVDDVHAFALDGGRRNDTRLAAKHMSHADTTALIPEGLALRQSHTSSNPQQFAAHPHNADYSTDTTAYLLG